MIEAKETHIKEVWSEFGNPGHQSGKCLDLGTFELDPEPYLLFVSEDIGLAGWGFLGEVKQARCKAHHSSRTYRV